MFFTQEDYRKIEKWLLANSRKDTDFVGAATPLKGNETVVLVQNGKNVNVLLKDLIEQIFLLGVSDFLNVTDKYGESRISLTQAIQLIPYKSRKIGQVITFLDEDGEWKLFQFQGERVNQWNNATLWVDLIKRIQGISIIDSKSVDNLNQTSLTFEDKNYNTTDYSGLGRVYLRKNIQTVVNPNTGITYSTNLLTQQMLNKENTIYVLQYDYSLNYQTISIPEGSILVFEGGDINNGTLNCNSTIIVGKFRGNATIAGTYSFQDAQADEEDITQSQSSVLKFKNKGYDEANFSGLGRTYLRKNIVNGVNVLTQDMINNPNTIYHIQYDYNLNGQTITIPSGCVLLFEGGSISNGVVKFNNTLLEGGINIDCTILGSLLNQEIKASWFVVQGSDISSILNITGVSRVIIDIPSVIEKAIIINEYKELIFNSKVISTVPKSTSEILFTLNKGGIIEGLDIDIQNELHIVVNCSTNTIIHNCKINYLFNDGDGTQHYAINVPENSKTVLIDNCEISGYKNLRIKTDTFIGVRVSEKTSNININGLYIHDIKVLTPDVFGDVNGVIRGVFWWSSTSTDNIEVSSGTITNSIFQELTTINDLGESIIGDADSIFMYSPLGGEPNNGITNVIISNCTIVNGGKRAFKIYSNGIKIKDCFITLSKSVLEMMLCQATNLTIENVVADIEGVCASFSNSKNIVFNNFKEIGGNGGTYATIAADLLANSSFNNCSFKNRPTFLILRGISGVTQENLVFNECSITVSETIYSDRISVNHNNTIFNDCKITLAQEGTRPDFPYDCPAIYNNCIFDLLNIYSVAFKVGSNNDYGKNIETYNCIYNVKSTNTDECAIYKIIHDRLPDTCGIDIHNAVIYSDVNKDIIFVSANRGKIWADGIDMSEVKQGYFSYIYASTLQKTLDVRLKNITLPSSGYVRLGGNIVNLILSNIHRLNKYIYDSAINIVTSPEGVTLGTCYTEKLFGHSSIYSIGYSIFNPEIDGVMIYDGEFWRNEDGTLLNKVNII